MNTIITIDGPVASGKSTVARGLAHEIGFNYLTSGLVYRAIAYVVLRDHPSCTIDDEQLRDSIKNNHMHYTWTNDGEFQVFWQNTNITPFLKTPALDECSSRLAQRPPMREYALSTQHALAEKHHIVAEGRDMGSVVFPHALVKFFLTADITTRAQRWLSLQKKLGNAVTLEESIDIITQRDTRDSQRAIAPLIVPESAIIIDTSARSVRDIVQEMLAIIDKKRLA